MAEGNQDQSALPEQPKPVINTIDLIHVASEMRASEQPEVRELFTTWKEKITEIRRLEDEGTLSRDEAIDATASLGAQAEYDKQKMEKDSLLDDKTEAHNARGFKLALARALSHGRRTKEPVVVMYCDLSGFKSVNDSLGHSVGDLALFQVAEYLKSYVRETDFVARMGGDEFAIGFINADINTVKEKFTKLREEDMPDSITEALETMELEGKPIVMGENRVTMSVGFALMQEDDSVETIIQRADQDMYKDKNGSGNGR